MKIHGNKIQVDLFTPLIISGNLIVTGGPAVQFYDGNYYLPDRESLPGSPILITHDLDAVDQDGVKTNFQFSTQFYENDALITTSTPKYELIDDHVLKVSKNIPHGTSVVIKAISQMLDERTGKVYKREDITYLRTMLKAESYFQLELSPRSAIFFDGYRNPNTTEEITAVLRKEGEELSDYSNITFKWLNEDGKNVIDYELYGNEITNSGRTLEVDKTYIDDETIRCEAWQDDKMIAFDTVTFTRKFNSFRADVRIPELPISASTAYLNCSVLVSDIKGNIDVDEAFLVKWFINEGGIEREVGVGASIRVPVSSLNIDAATLEIYPDLCRREAWAALVDDDDYLLTDDEDNILTIETYGD